MPRVETLTSSHRWSPLGRRASEVSRGRRGLAAPTDKYLDFDTQITTMIWLADNTDPVQTVLYPREDLRVRLSDHKLELAGIGLEIAAQEFLPARFYRETGAGRWWTCGWNTPLKVCAPGDTILLVASGVSDLKDFEVHEPHLRIVDNFCHADTHLNPPGLTLESLRRRRREYPSDSLLDFNTPITTMIWIEVILYPREDLRVRLCDHTTVLAALGFQSGEDGLVERFHRQQGSGSWWSCNWQTPLKVSGVGDTLLLCLPGVERLQDFETHEPHM
ncbi:hypothetical protein B0H15DRAFT_963739 [Mycena belliarum]|uniref:Uncharacterized protein n=1 Tax=Mycena belliarum TaxID=1033014 RepID=A0AAD6TPP8_9AGAR|nr:hypothetical protein B0H15DRAFT_963739 [Mycena belliae]